MTKRAESPEDREVRKRRDKYKRRTVEEEDDEVGKDVKRRAVGV